MTTINEAVDKYIKLRDKKAELAKIHAAQMKPYRDALEQIENWLLAVLNNQDAESIRTDTGTCYKTIRTQAKVTDWATALDFIRDNDLFHMLEKRVSKSAIEEFVEAQGKPPPGVDITQEIRINVRR